jgi:prolipoprotein diacylglyceryltransferase
MPGFHLVELSVLFLLLLIGLLGTIFWLWMIVDCATHEPSEDQDKMTWMLLIVLTHFIGACLYFLIRRPARMRTVG